MPTLRTYRVYFRAEADGPVSSFEMPGRDRLMVADYVRSLGLFPSRIVQLDELYIP